MGTFIRPPVLLSLPILICLAALPAGAAPLPQQEPAVSGIAEDTAGAEPLPGTPQAILEILEAEARLRAVTDGIASAEGVFLDILRARYDRILDRLVSLCHDTARSFLRRTASGQAPAGEGEQISAAVARIPGWVVPEIDRIREAREIPRPTQTALEQAHSIARMRVESNRLDELMDYLITNAAIGRDLGLDTGPEEEALRETIRARAENLSDYLYVVTQNLSELRFQLGALPDDDELKAKVSVTERHVRLAADALRSVAHQMEDLGMNASTYNAQLITATGSLTTDILDFGVIRDLLRNTLAGFGTWFSEHGAGILFRGLFFLGILLASWKVARIVERVTAKALASSRFQLSQLLQVTIVSAARSGILLLGILIALAQLGVSLGPLLAGLGIAGFIMGFALQDSLSNFASGLLILLYRPFDTGDLVELSGATGTVSAMSLVNTTILTVDNQTLVVPNNQVWQNVIKNVTAQTTRRVDMVFGISYSDDIDKADRILREILAENERILPDPEPLVRLHELGESSVDFAARAWVRTEDYWEVYWEVTRRVKVRFDQEGISIPFPQRDVHVYADASGSGGGNGGALP